jgi:hypothetical protein
MSKLIALGCSFTRWSRYPTWADLLSNYPQYFMFQNWGMSGLGNRGIFNRLNEVILKKHITKDDTIVIMWSTTLREDRLFYGKGWVPCGNIYNQPIYSKEWIEEYFDPFMGLMETVNYVHAAQHMLDNIGCNWAMAWMSNPSDSNQDKNWAEWSPSRNKTVADLSDPDKKLVTAIDKINSHPRIITKDMYEFKNYSMQKYNIPKLMAYQSDGKVATEDGHPNSLVGYYFLKEQMLPVLGITDFDQDGRVFELAKAWSDYTSQSIQDQEQRPNFSLTHKDFYYVYPGNQAF